MKTRLLITAAILATGCATPATPTWHHPTKSTQEFYRDNSQCMAMAGSGQANQVVGDKPGFTRGYNQSLAMLAQRNQRLIHEQCMYGNGWYSQETPPK